LAAEHASQEEEAGPEESRREEPPAQQAKGDREQKEAHPAEGQASKRRMIAGEAGVATRASEFSTPT